MTLPPVRTKPLMMLRCTGVLDELQLVQLVVSHPPERRAVVPGLAQDVLAVLGVNIAENLEAVAYRFPLLASPAWSVGSLPVS